MSYLPETKQQPTTQEQLLNMEDKIILEGLITTTLKNTCFNLTGDTMDQRTSLKEKDLVSSRGYLPDGEFQKKNLEIEFISYRLL